MEPARPPLTAERVIELAAGIRQASRAGTVVALGEICSAGEEEFLALAAAQGIEDIAALRRDGRSYFYSEPHMTRGYAEMAALAASNDPLQAIAETVRSDSLTYPRPTPVAVFMEPPFSISAESVSAALDRLAADARFRDVRPVTASDGSRFLFSSNHLDPARAASMAEWLAVGRRENP